jgi:hypothetical protein
MTLPLHSPLRSPLRSPLHSAIEWKWGGGPEVRLSSTSIAEDAADNTVVGALSVANLGVLTVSSYAITADPSNKFAISGTNLIIDELLDYETATSHTVTIEATLSDASTTSRTFPISVTDVDPEYTLRLLALSGLSQDTGGATPASANTDPVGQWEDAYSSKDFEQGTAGARPQLLTAIPSVKFDGTNDYLAYAGTIADTVGSVIMAFKTGTAFTADMAIVSSADTGSANNWFEIGINVDGKMYISSNAAGTVHKVVGSTFLDVSTDYIAMIVHDGTDYYMTVGGVEENPLVIESIGSFAWFGDVTGADNVVVGGTVTSAGLVRPFNGALIELNVYAQDITA